MFATLNNNIRTNAARQLAFIHAGIFYVRRHSSITLYRCPSTPVYRLNGHTAFVRECVKRRDRLGHLLFLLCYSITNFPTLHRLVATERRPTKRVFNVYLLLFPTFTRRISGIRKTGLPGFLISPAGKPPWGQPLYPN